MNIKAQFVAAIEATGDPTAPIKLQDTYNAVSTLGALMMQGKATHDQTQQFAETLLKSFPEEMDHLHRCICFTNTES